MFSKELLYVNQFSVSHAFESVIIECSALMVFHKFAEFNSMSKMGYNLISTNNELRDSMART